MAIKHLTYAAIPLIAASLNTQAATVDQLNRQVQKLNQRLAAQDQRFRVNGFATFSLAKSDEAVPYDKIGDETDWTTNTRAGIQMSFQMNPDTSVVTQMVARGASDFDTKTEWAYIKRQLNSSTSAKLGRIRGPYYMLSEYLDVGYAVPWAKMPTETYALMDTFANIDGVDITWDTDIGWNTLQLSAFYGQTSDENYSLTDAFGASATYSTDTWSVRLATATADLSLLNGSEGATLQAVMPLFDPGSAGKSLKGVFTSLGFRYDPGDVLMIAEYTTATVDSIVQDQDSAFVSFGYRVDAWTPTITYGMHESTDNSERATPLLPANAVLTDGSTVAQAQVALQSASQADATRVGLAVRYDLDAGVALKFQYDVVDADEAGLFDPDGYSTAVGAGSAPDKANIMTFSIDTVF